MSPEHIIRQALERYERPLISHARAITGDLESARDAVQETFLRLSRQDVQALEHRLAPWLFFVCRNCALDHQRKVVRFTDAPPDEDHPSTDPDPAGGAAASDDARILRDLVQKLTPDEQEIVRLKFDAGLSYKEISETLRISVSNVGVRLHHAVQTLRTLWKKETSEVLP